MSVSLFEVIYFYLWGSLCLYVPGMQVLASHLGWLNIAGLCSFYFSFSILSTQVLNLQRCSFHIKASEAHQARHAPLRCFSSIAARCPLRLPVPELTGSVTGPCRKRYDIVPNEISACSPLAPGHLLLLRRLFSSNGEAYYCIQLSKSHLGEKKVMCRETVGDGYGRFSPPANSHHV